MSSCYLHPEAPAPATCRKCQRPICASCTTDSLDGATFCPPCFSRRKTMRRVVVGGGTVAALALVVTAVLLIVRSTGRTASPVAIKRRDERRQEKVERDRAEADRLRGALAREPCDRRSALSLGELLNGMGDHESALRLVDEFLAKCGEFPRLLWVKVLAHEERREWQKAADVATLLIRERPDDQDYWWWRGKHLAELGRLDEAAADLLQSMATDPNHFAASRLAKLADEAKRPCDAALALSRYIEDPEERPAEIAFSKRTELYLAGGCDELAGRGKATIRFRPDAPVVRASAALGGKTSAGFVVDENAAFVVVTRALAEQAGLAPAETPVVQVMAVGELKTARLAVAPEVRVSGASAARVHVAVVDSLPPRVEGVIGQSFLVRFAVERDEAKGAIKLSPREALDPAED